jgi:hypothetical protein
MTRYATEGEGQLRTLSLLEQLRGNLLNVMAVTRGYCRFGQAPIANGPIRATYSPQLPKSPGQKSLMLERAEPREFSGFFSRLRLRLL